MTESGTKSPLIWIFAGESSGDVYGANLAREIWSHSPNAKIAGMGGAKMKEAGVDILVDSTELGVVGLIEVMGNIFKFIKIMKYLEREAIRQRPDAVVLIDYPGFNIRFAKRMWKAGIKVVWYISPQVWAWRKSNIPKLATYCKKMMLIFPFEVDVYKGSGLDAEFVGHPLVEIVRKRTDGNIKRDPNRVLLLPGSRKSETKRLLSPMLKTAAILKNRRPELKFALAAPREKIYGEIVKSVDEFRRKHPALNVPEIDICCGETSRWLQESSVGLAASGTVTVECAIAGLPLVVAYRLNPITFLLARLVIRKLFRGFFTMVNIIVYKKVFEEYLQHQVVPADLADAVEKILPGGERRIEVESDMKKMIDEISGGAETASSHAARVVLQVAMNS